MATGTSVRHQVLVVTASPVRREPLVEHLVDMGYDVSVAGTADADTEADLTIVDVVDAHLWPVAEELVGGRLILLVTAPSDMVRGFSLGADDCVLDDARVEELAARSEAVLRRTGQPSGALPQGQPAVYADRRLWINFDSRQIWVAGRPAQLTPREFRLLRELIRHCDKTLRHEELLEAVWGRSPRHGRTPEVLKQYVWRLRQKIEPDPNAPRMVVTDPGEGYRFVSAD